MNLAVHPIVLGSGKSLLQDIDGRKHFTLRSSLAYSTGLVMLSLNKVEDTYEAKK